MFFSASDFSSSRQRNACSRLIFTSFPISSPVLGRGDRFEARRRRRLKLPNSLHLPLVQATFWWTAKDSFVKCYIVDPIVSCCSSREMAKAKLDTLGMKWSAYTERGVWSPMSNSTPELVYQLVAPNFTDLVWKIEIQKSLWNTDKYEQVVILSEESAVEMKEKGLVIERSDYFSALKVFCLKFSYEFGLQAVKIFGRKKSQISVFLVPPGSFFNYDRKRNQIDANTYFNFKYQVNFVIARLCILSSLSGKYWF